MTIKNDQDVFKNAMIRVKPLQKKKLATLSHKKNRQKPRVSLIEQPPIEKEYSDEFIVPCGKEEELFFAHSGIQPKILKQLKQGKLPIQAVIDLHGLSLAQADARLQQFLTACRSKGLRAVLVVHGKGAGKLKSAVRRWLEESAETLAFSSAQPRDGGKGAVYLLLRRAREIGKKLDL